MSNSTKPVRQQIIRDKQKRSPGRPAGRTASQGVIADRDTLLRAAEALIREQGPGVSLTAIALQAGVSKPILYRELGDRDALVNALAERLATRMAQAAAQLVARAEGPKTALSSLVRSYLSLAEEERHLYLFVTAGGGGRDSLQHALLLADGAASQFAEPIAAYRRTRGADPGVATVWSYGLLGALHYITLWWLRDRHADLDRVVEQMTDLLWHGMGVTS